MSFEEFKEKIEEVCMRKACNNEVKIRIIEIIDKYSHLGVVQLLTYVPAILVLTKREKSLEYTIRVVNGWVCLTTQNFTVKVI